MNEIAPAKPIKLQDGTKLDQRQTQAVLLTIETNLTQQEIADRVGYASGSVVGTFLRSEKGQQALMELGKRSLASAASIGLQRMIQLAQQDTNKTVAQLAAKDLMDRAGLRINAQQDAGETQSAREVKITINLPGHTDEDMVDVTPTE